MLPLLPLELVPLELPVPLALLEPLLLPLLVPLALLELPLLELVLVPVVLVEALPLLELVLVLELVLALLLLAEPDAMKTSIIEVPEVLVLESLLAALLLWAKAALAWLKLSLVRLPSPSTETFRVKMTKHSIEAYSTAVVPLSSPRKRTRLAKHVAIGISPFPMVH
ncbi:MAG TPA: hypothetical protein VMG10_13240 [Gemmataceae bacterium]|nr:hypothetical protein [Gemmataceae bacterium]